MYNLLLKLLLILQNSGQILWNLWFYVIIGVLIGEILKFTSWRKLIYKHVSKSPLISTFSAVILGMVSPLCTYGTVPVVVQLFRAGVPVAPLVAFLSASSMMNPQLFLITASGISPEMAIARIIVITIFAMLLGLILNKLPLSWIINSNVLKNMDNEKEELQCSSKLFTWKALFKNSLESLEFIGFYLVIGILIGAIIQVLVPDQWIFTLFSAGKWYSVILASILGVPLYACGGGTIPFISALVKKGMSKGSALAFLTVGSATRPTPLMAIATILRPIFIVAYILFLIIFSFFVGIIYN